jgi:hypothetical protein
METQVASTSQISQNNNEDDDFESFTPFSKESN